MSAAPMKKQMKPNKAERTGAQPFRKEITSSPQARGPIGRHAKTVKAMKSIPNIIVIIFKTPIYDVIARSVATKQSTNYKAFL